MHRKKVQFHTKQVSPQSSTFKVESIKDLTFLLKVLISHHKQLDHRPMVKNLAVFTTWLHFQYNLQFPEKKMCFLKMNFPQIDGWSVLKPQKLTLGQLGPINMTSSTIIWTRMNRRCLSQSFLFLCVGSPGNTLAQWWGLLPSLFLPQKFCIWWALFQCYSALN